MEVCALPIGFCVCEIILLLAEAVWGITTEVLFCLMGVYGMICAPFLVIYAAIDSVIQDQKRKKEKAAARCSKNQ